MVRVSEPWKEVHYLAFFPAGVKVKGDDSTKCRFKHNNQNNGIKIKSILLLTNEEAFKEYFVYVFEDWCDSSDREYSIGRATSGN